MIGGSGSYCPGLFPLSSSIRLKATMFSSVFSNFDGILAITPEEEIGHRRKKPIYLMLLWWLLPIE